MASSRFERALQRGPSRNVLIQRMLFGNEAATRASPAIDALRRHQSPAARELDRQVTMLARHPQLPVLIEGESGSGKTLVSQALHDLSVRASSEFVRTDLAAVQPELAASQLFGHLPGAFTGAIRERVGDFTRANRGTIFLDEIGKCPLSVQQQLLGCIEYGQIRPLGAERFYVVDVRVLVATSIPLPTLVSHGQFLPDLQYRLMAGWIRIPPLRERREDIPVLLAEHLAQAAAACGRRATPTVSDEFLDACMAYDWPANLRELAAVAQRALLEAGDAPTIRTKHVPDLLPFGQACKRRFRHVSTEEVLASYHRSGANVKRAARALDVDRSTVYRHLARAGVGSGPKG